MSKLVFFDFDGTLSEGGLQAMQKNKLLGLFKNLVQTVPQTSGDLTSIMKSKVFEKLWTYYIKNKSEHEIRKDIRNLLNERDITLFPEVKDLANIKGYDFHIISRSPIEFIEEVLEQGGARALFGNKIYATTAEKKLKKVGKFDVNFYTGNLSVKPRTPKERAQKIFSVMKDNKTNDVVIVGDSWTDVQTSLNVIKLLKNAGKEANVKLIVGQTRDIQKMKRKMEDAGGMIAIAPTGHPLKNIKKII